MRRTFKVATLAAIIVALILFIEQMFNLIVYLIFAADSVKLWIGWTAAFISIVMYLKTVFIDTGMYKKLQKTYGKHRFIIALTTILEMLDTYEPDDIIRKILLVNEVEIDMHRALVELKGLIYTDGKKIDFQIDLTKREKNRLKKEIKLLLDLIDKKVTIHYLGKDIKNYMDNRFENARESFKETLSKSKLKKDIIESHNKENDKITKEKLVKEFKR